ncbi:hypothetical protein B0T19DRAFT_398851 [Cercophora scortea]|uniref:Uncharacterized protein n=1 Tax=Cercophora scortea TaxID=314031 RepID=A0AAE0MJ96_9PEZI|nr:hypothetical protein B0T19DRAFT_398851 [Cercophora scortea]
MDERATKARDAWQTRERRLCQDNNANPAEAVAVVVVVVVAAVVGLRGVQSHCRAAFASIEEYRSSDLYYHDHALARFGRHTEVFKPQILDGKEAESEPLERMEVAVRVPCEAWCPCHATIAAAASKDRDKAFSGHQTAPPITSRRATSAWFLHSQAAALIEFRQP